MTEQQARVAEPSERFSQIAPTGNAIDRLIVELTAEHGADLRHILCSRAEPIEPSDQRGTQRRRYRESVRGRVPG